MTAAFSHRRINDFAPLTECDVRDVVISEEDLARYCRLAMTESNAAQPKSKICSLADMTILDRIRENGTFMGVY